MSRENILLQLDAVEETLELFEQDRNNCIKKDTFVNSAQTLIKMLNDKIKCVEHLHSGECRRLLTREEMLIKARQDKLI